MRKQNRHENKQPVPESEYHFVLARVAVSQICQSTGYKAAQSPALDALTDIATRYLREIAKFAAASANSGCRTQSNIADVVAALEELASVQGFSGLSTVGSPSASTSPVVKGLMRFVKYADEIPFAQPLPPRKSFLQQGVGARGNLVKCSGDCDNHRIWYCDGGGSRHVPRWLPAAPAVVEEGRAEGKKREVKWGCLDARGEERGEENGGCLDVREEREERETNNGIETLGKRGKLRFKMGLGLGNNPGLVGNMRIGKRVWCE